MSTKKNAEAGFLDFLAFPAAPSRRAEATGQHRRGVLVVLGEEPSNELRGFLEKVFGAVQCDLEADALLLELTDDKNFSFARLASETDLQKAVFFGVLPARAELTFNHQKYQVLQAGGRRFLFADQLSEIHAQPALKRPLWEGLQALFGV